MLSVPIVDRPRWRNDRAPFHISCSPARCGRRRRGFASSKPRTRPIARASTVWLTSATTPETGDPRRKLSSGERSALAKIGASERKFETLVALNLILRRLHQDPMVAGTMSQILTVTDSVDRATTDFGIASDSARADEQRTAADTVRRTMGTVGIICAVAVIVAVFTIVAMLDRHALSLATESRLKLEKDAAEQADRLKSDFLAER